MSVFQGTRKWIANFQLTRSKVKVTAGQKSKKYLAYVFICGRQKERANCRKVTT